MLEKICEYCSTKFTLPNLHQKNIKRRFCGALCSRRWAANNRSNSWKEKNSLSKQGELNPMFGITQTNLNSIANLNRKGSSGKTQSSESNQKRSKSLIGIKRTPEHINKVIQTKISRGIFWKPDDPEYNEFKKYRRKVYYWTNKNELSQLDNYEMRSKTGYHLDHKYSISMGFKNNIPPHIVGSIYNLEFILVADNVKKGIKCSITKEKLYELFSGSN
jgi:hypothetical protein